MKLATTLGEYLAPLPLVAVLRGITRDEVDGVASVLVAEGFRILEIPLNSPEPFASIRVLANAHGSTCLVGAGTVLEVADVQGVADAGGRLIVMPHCDVAVVQEAKRLGLICLPGVATPSEAFAALRAGADAVKMFPAEALPPAVVKAWRAVLPRHTAIFPVGGIKPESLAAYWAAGATGFGTGSNLYQPGMSLDQVRRAAQAYAAAFRALPARADS